jgi:hypothetical protein
MWPDEWLLLWNHSGRWVSIWCAGAESLQFSRHWSCSQLQDEGTELRSSNQVVISNNR